MIGADLIVVGLGAAGAATLYQAARQGARVIGIDRHHPPHDQGSSHGETRITRQAIGEGEEYVPLALRAHELWREIEAETGEALMLSCGALMISPRDLGAAHRGKHHFLERTIAAAKAFSIDHEVLNAAEARARFPQLRVGEGETAYFEPGAGLVYPERCIATQLALAQRHGASLHPGETVLALEPAVGGVAVVTDKGRYEAAGVVVAAGAWAPGLLGGVYGERLALHRQTQHWFAPADPALFGPDRLPVFIWLHGETPGDWFYGFPIIPGSPGVKIASEQFDVAVGDPGDLNRMATRQEALAIHARHVPKAGSRTFPPPGCDQRPACTRQRLKVGSSLAATPRGSG